MFNKKSQGEIFGIALMFVIIIVGIVIYSQFKVINPDRNEDDLLGDKFQIIAQTSLEAILKKSTGCNVERGRDKISDLINTCLDRSWSRNDVKIFCGDDDTDFIYACDESIKIINDTLIHLYNSSLIGPLIYEMYIDIPDDEDSIMSNITLTNLGSFKYRDYIVNESNYDDFDFKKAPSGLKTWSTSQNNIEISLNIYYK